MRKRTKLVLLVAVGGVAYGARQMQRPRPATIEPVRPQSWAKLDDPVEPTAAPPPPEPASEPTPDVEIRGFVAESAPSQTWLPPIDGVCPASHPLKGNDSSKIVHSPGGLSYARTVPERCYATIEDAVADGYRAAKR